MEATNTVRSKFRLLPITRKISTPRAQHTVRVRFPAVSLHLRQQLRDPERVRLTRIPVARESALCQSRQNEIGVRTRKRFKYFRGNG